MINLRYRKSDYNSGVQLQISNFPSLYPIIYFDLRAAESLTGDPETLTLHYRLNEVVSAHDYTIYVVVLNEEEIVMRNELVAA